MTTNRRQRRTFTAAEKVRVLKEHLVDKVPVSQVCEQHQINPTMFYNWQKQLFENGEAAFQRTTPTQRSENAVTRRVEALQQKITEKNEVIAELLAEHVQLKKANGEP